MERGLLKIIHTSGREVSSCQCPTCRNQCRTPCLGTPDDILALIEAGYRDKLMPTQWCVGMVVGKLGYPITMLQAIQGADGWCVFRTADGLCGLHNAGLKPTEGKLSHHSITDENFDFYKGLSYNVAKEWLMEENMPVIEKIVELYAAE